MGVLFAVLAYALLAMWADAREVIESWTELDPWVFTAALGLSVVNYAFRYLKWVMYLRLLGERVEHRINIPVFLAGFSMAVTPGKIGEVLKSSLLKDARGISVAKTAPIVLAERLTDLIALVLMAAFGASAFGIGLNGLVIVMLVLLSGMLFIQRRDWVLALLGVIRWKRLLGIRQKLEEAYESARTLLAFKVTILSVLLSVVSWSMEGLAFYLIVNSLGGEATLSSAIFVFSMSTVLGALSFLPGGLGVAEGSMLGMLKALGIFTERAPALLSTYVIRFTTLWFAVLIGFVALSLHRRQMISSLDHQNPSS